LEFLFRQVTCLAIFLALYRVYPSFSDFDWVAFPLKPMVIEWLILAIGGTVAGVFVGGFFSAVTSGARTGAAISIPLALAWVVLRAHYYQFIANSI
jgi:hypothetical protein